MTPPEPEPWATDLHRRVARQRERLLAHIGRDWVKLNLGVEDGPAEMIALDQMATEGLIEFDQRWLVRLSP